jgi:hypothetical protein
MLPVCPAGGLIRAAQGGHRAQALGPRVFTYLTDDTAQWLSTDDRDAIALSVREALT